MFLRYNHEKTEMYEKHSSPMRNSRKRKKVLDAKSEALGTVLIRQQESLQIQKHIIERKCRIVLIITIMHFLFRYI